MSVREAGKRGGYKTRDTHGPEFYQQIGSKGGQRVKELVRLAKGEQDRGI